MIRVHNEINGRWLQYCLTIRNLERLKKDNKDRINFYDYEQIRDPYIYGFIPSEKEWRLEKPNYEKDELISIAAVNSKEHFLRLSIFKSRNVRGKVTVKIQFSLKVTENDVYSIEEQYCLPVNEIKANEYKAGALFVEILNPFRKLRIKFRGYLKNETTGEIVFAQLRLHWYALTNVFDHKYNYESKFIARQLIHNNSKNIEVEDRIEQFGNIKGTVNIEKEPEKQLFLWGLRSKTICERVLRSSRLICVSKDGVAFDMGYVNNKESQYSYSYGLVAGSNAINGIISSDNDLSNITSSAFQCQLKTTNNTFIVDIEPKTNDHIRNASVNGIDAKCLFFNEEFNDYTESHSIQNQLTLAYSVSDVTQCSSDLVLTLDNIRAQSVNLSGGKGSSLVALTRLSEISNRFKVPQGLIVTSNAYNLLLEENSEIAEQLQKLEKLTWTHGDSLKSECVKTQELISNKPIPERVKSEIIKYLHEIYGNSLKSKKFAIRSSAVGEDSEEMSGAGQLTTYLGVKGIDEILKAVMKCWGSQFGYNYTEYKRGYGQLINNSMAVVILEMVDCDTAGVIFTCDPINGDERTVVITANYGLGESVVSASSEPDTIKIKVGVKSNDLNVNRTVEGIDKIEIGKKATYIKMNETGGTVELDVENNSDCCVSKDDLLRLTEVALNIHAYYGNARDIEWGIKDGVIYMFQSRPITNLDSYNEWEIMHDLDAGFQQERGYFSRLHWNENFPGASSPLCLSFTIKLLDSTFQKFLNQMSDQGRRNISNFCPYILRPLATYYSQVFFNFREFAANISKDKNDNRAYVGKDILGDDIKAELKPETNVKLGFFAKIRLLLKLLFAVIFSGRFVGKTERKLKSINWFAYKESQTPKQLFSEITRGAYGTFLNVARVHSVVSMTAGIFTKLILKILTSSTANEKDALSDFAKIQEANTKIVSAEVPKLFQDIVNAVDNKAAFSALSDEEALQYLLNDSNSASKLFKSFLEKHGYRGMREMDPYVLQWGDDPIKLIPMLKNASQKVKEISTKVVSVAELLSSLKTKPSFIKKLLLRVFIPLSFRGTRLREQSKSLLVYFISKHRTAFYCLAHKLSVEEGKLPEKDLLFFLTLSEIEQLINDRNPTLVAKAKQRKRMREKLDKLQFPLIVRDWELTPVNIEKRIDVSKLDGAVSVQGTAVTSLVIKGRACVAPSLEDAKYMKNGDILITYTTDIGWSPYFPIVSGVVTEMGGLNSHGAVIAREFGLPCIVGAENACEMFKTGDTVLIDGEKGTITKLNENVGTDLNDNVETDSK